MGTLRITGEHTGHRTVHWDPDDKKGTAKAKATFEKLREKQYRIFRIRYEQVEAKGDELEVFDPQAGEYVAIGPQAGG